MTDSLLQFPCDFPLKIMGDATSTFFSGITGIILQHFPQTDLQKITKKVSKQGNYLAITAIVYPLNQAELDALYRDLSHYPGVKMVL